jgi:WD40 repeat protein/tRNA A-37 threonylcarbamoyl transferase component Bud32
MDTARLCTLCGEPIGPALNGLCPQCLLAQAAAPTPMSSTTGPAIDPAVENSFGDYEILDGVAEGGMGVVYYARQISLNRAVALKMIRSGHLASPSEVQRFRTEAEAAATLDHPHIVPIYEIGEHKSRHYFTMKLLDGGNLAERLARSKASPREAARLTATLARAVHHAHERGILHRDIKPTNILLDETGQPHLTDFGLAKVLHHSRNVTQSRVVLGTPSYMAPEQAMGEQITTAADVYSLGALLYEMLAGRPPFKGDTALEILSQVRDKEPERLHKLLAGVDRDLEAICLKCLEKEVARRYASALALATDLEHWIAGKPVQARPATSWVRAKKWARRNPAVASLAAMSVILLLAGITGVLLQWRRAESHAKNAQAKATESRDRLARLHAANGVRALESGDNLAALVHFAESFDLDRDRPERHRSHQLRLASVIRQTPKLLHMWFPGGAVHSAEFSGDGTRVLATSSNAVTVWKTEGDSLPFPPIHHEGPGQVFAQFAPCDAVISANGDTVCLWSARDGTRQQTFLHPGVRRAAMSPDGKWIASAGAGTIKLWQTTNAPAIPITIDSVENIVALEFSPNGKTLLIVPKDGAVRVQGLDLETAPVRFNAGRDVRHAAFNFNATRIVTARSDSSAQVWNALTGEPVTGAMKESTWLTHSEFSPDGKWIVASAGGHRASIWNAETGKKRSQLGGHANVVVGSSFSPSGERVVTYSFDGTARIYEAESGRRLFPPLWHGGMVTAARFHPDGQRVLTASADGAVRLWSLWPEALTVVPGGEENVAMLGDANNGAALLVQTPEHSLEVWDTASWKPVIAPIRVTNRLARAWISADHKLLVTLARRGDLKTNELTIEVRNASNGAVLRSRSFTRPTSDIVTVSPNCSHFVLHSKTAVDLFDLTTGGQLSLPQTTQRVDSVRFSPDSSALLVIAGSEALVIEVSSGQFRFPPIRHDCPIRSGTFSGDSARFVTCPLDDLLAPREAQVWDAATGKPVGLPLRHGDGIFYASFSPKNDAVVTASEDGTARLWHADTGRALGPPLKHSVAVHHASFSPDGQWVATASLDKTARVWDATTGEPLTPPLNHDWRVDQAAFLANGRYLLTLSGYVVSSIWDLSAQARSLDDSVALATLLSSHKLDETGALSPVAADELRELWHRLREKYPNDYARESSPNLKIPPRDPRLGNNQLDLSPHYNALLSEAGNPSTTNASPVPQGVQTFEDVQFDVRGIVQLASITLPTWSTRPFPEAVKGIQVQQPFSRIHLLHGTGAFEQTGKRIASLFLHYADGEMRELSIIAGQHAGDWQTWRDAGADGRAKPVWSGKQIPSRVWTRALHWYKSTWSNPRPGEVVTHIDYVSAMGPASPYLIAATIEQ